MLTTQKANYQVKLILSYLSEEEYKKIPKDIIDYIEKNYEYDENIKINPSIPLEHQNIDASAYKLLEKILIAIENEEKDSFIKSTIKEDLNIKVSKITWEKILSEIQDEKEKNKKAKELLNEYIKITKEKEIEIEKLKNHNEELYKIIKKIPKFILKIFIKQDTTNLLNK